MKKTGNPRKKSKKLKNKVFSQQKHAVRRAEERYGLHLSGSDLNGIKNQIQNGGAEFLEKQTNRVSVFSVATPNGSVPVVYDNQRHTVVSFLPETYFETGSLRKNWND
jgi:hypothetical protein